MSNCYLHTDRSSFSECLACGVQLCEDCSTMFEDEICTNCKEVQIKENLKGFAIRIVAALIIYAIMLNWLSTKPNDGLNAFLTYFTLPVAFTIVSLKKIYVNISTNKFVLGVKEFFYKMIVGNTNSDPSIIGKLLAIFVVAVFFVATFTLILTVYGFYALYLEIRQLITHYKEHNLIKGLANIEPKPSLKEFKSDDLNSTVKSILKLSDVDASVISNCEVKDSFDFSVKYLDVVVRWYSKSNFYTSTSSISHSKQANGTKWVDDFERSMTGTSGGMYKATTYDVNYQISENVTPCEEYASGVFKNKIFVEVTPPKLIEKLILNKNLSFKNFSLATFKNEYSAYVDEYNEKLEVISNRTLLEYIEPEIIEKSTPSYTHENFSCEYGFNKPKDDYSVEAELSLIEFDHEGKSYFLAIDYTNNNYQLSEQPKEIKKVG